MFNVAITTCDDAVSWVVAGDQAIFNFAGIDVSKIRYEYNLASLVMCT